MRPVLSVSSEVAPLVKTGGLADVAGALPGAMAAEGWGLRTLLPGYPAVLEAIGDAKPVWAEDDLFGGPARMLAGTVAGLDLLVLEAAHLYGREGSIYLGPDGKDWPDNPERYAALCWAAADIAIGGADGWMPELLHLHDWQAALAPTYLRARGRHRPNLLTIHNMAFHGLAPGDRVSSLRLPPARFAPDGFEFYGQVSTLKAGLMDADAISTVSPAYARELLTPEFGMGMDGILRNRAADLYGIVNGIDTAIWDPAQDGLITHPYAAARGKAKNRAVLIEEFGIEAPVEDGPLCIVVSRLTEQKGLDLLAAAVPTLTGAGGMLALLGSGSAELEAAFRDLAAENPAVGVRIGYDEALSHRMYAGGDAVLVPSRFEPCGLTQLYGLRYGALPLVARTGGLADTEIDANPAALRAGVATGVQFSPVTQVELTAALLRLCALYREQKLWAKMQRNAMKQPVDWADSAAEYAGLYEQLTG